MLHKLKLMINVHIGIIFYYFVSRDIKILKILYDIDIYVLSFWLRMDVCKILCARILSRREKNLPGKCQPLCCCFILNIIQNDQIRYEAEHWFYFPKVLCRITSSFAEMFFFSFWDKNDTSYITWRDRRFKYRELLRSILTKLALIHN